MKKLWMVKIIFHLDLPKPNIINVSCDIGEQIRELNITHLIYIEEMLSIIQIPLNALESTKLAQNGIYVFSWHTMFSRE